MTTAPTHGAEFQQARVAVAATFGSHAVAAGTIGPWVPALKANAGLGAAALGIALFGFALGLVSGTRLAGPITRRLGARPVVRAGIPALALALAVLPFARALPTLTGSFALVGIVSGLLDVAMNDEAAAVEETFARRVMSSMHAVWSVSMLAGAGVASVGIASGLAIQAYFGGVAAVLIVATFPALRWLPRRSVRGRDEVATLVDTPGPPFMGVALLCAIAAAGFMTEGIASEWSAVYLREGLGVAAGTAGLGVVASPAAWRSLASPATASPNGSERGHSFARVRWSVGRRWRRRS